MSEEEAVDEIHGWVKLETDDGKEYYYNPDLNLTQWEPPDEGYQEINDHEEEEEVVEEQPEYIEPEPEPQPEYVEEQHYEEEEAVATYTEADADDQPTAPISKTTTHMATPASPIAPRAKRAICRWELKETASFGAGTGNDAGDKYYLNKETGETVWEEPDDYFDDKEEAIKNRQNIIITLAPIDEDTTIEIGFDILDLYGEDAEHELNLLRSGDMSAAEACLKRLNYLEQLFQNVGSEDEWRDTIVADEYALAERTYDYLSGEGDTPAEIRLCVCRLLVQFSKLDSSEDHPDSQISILIMSERWGDLSFLLHEIKSGISFAECKIANEDGGDEKEEDRESRMMALSAWFLLLSQLFTATQDYGLPNEILPVSFFKQVCCRFFNLMVVHY